MDQFLNLAPSEQVASIIENQNETQINEFFSNLAQKSQLTQEWIDAISDPNHKNNLLSTITKFANNSPNGTRNLVILMKYLARIDGQESFLCQTESISILFTILDTNKSDDILIDGCKTLGFLSVAQNVPQEFHDGAIKALAKILQNFSKNSKLVCLSCAALSNLCYNKFQNKRRFLEICGHSELLSVFANFHDEEKPKAHAALLMRSICNSAKKNTKTNFLFSHNEYIVDDVIRSMVATQDSLVCQKHLIWALINLSINKSPIKSAIGLKGAFPQITSAMYTYLVDTDLQDAAFIVIKQLCGTSPLFILFYFFYFFLFFFFLMVWVRVECVDRSGS